MLSEREVWRIEKKNYVSEIIRLHEKVIGGDNPRLEKALYKLTLFELDDLCDLFSLLEVPWNNG